MVELKFTGTPAEIKAEIKEFIGLEAAMFAECKAEKLPKKVEEPKATTPIEQVQELPKAEETKLPTMPAVEEVPTVLENTVLPTLPTVSVEYTVEDLQKIGASRRDTKIKIL